MCIFFFGWYGFNGNYCYVLGYLIIFDGDLVNIFLDVFFICYVVYYIFCFLFSVVKFIKYIKEL